VRHVIERVRRHEDQEQAPDELEKPVEALQNEGDVEGRVEGVPFRRSRSSGGSECDAPLLPGSGPVMPPSGDGLNN
jgi:hypothetical protein